jgi:poly(3-hydroxybutyrate) depolymerase
MSRFFSCLIFIYGLVLRAQDAGMVLSTSVGYNTQKATLALSEEQRRQADQLGREAQQAGLAGKFGEALRDYYQGLAVMRNVPWTPSLEFASSLQGKLDHALVEPGRPVTVTLASLYSSPRAAGTKISASLALVTGKKDSGQVLGSTLPLNSAALPFTTRITLPQVPAGDYTLEVRLSAEGEPPVEAARPSFVKALPIHVEALSDLAEQFRNRLTKLGEKDGSAVATAGYALALYDRADRGEINPTRYNFRIEFAAANALLDALEAGRDPFAAKHGDIRKAYRSAVDNTLQPYRLLIPESYSDAKPAPLVVALHGMGGDENSMFDSYNNGQLKREAERVGLVVVCPKGRDTASMYRGSAEQDVMDVLAEVRRDYKIDPNRIYLMGHSMGGYGTWSVAMAHPDVFAALGPISGGGDPAGMVKIRHIPQYVVHGDDDRTVSVTQSRTMVEAGKKAGANIVYVEVPGGSHVSVAAPQFGPMLDFFAKQAKTQ